MSNRDAFLKMIKKSEGVDGIGDNGYNALFGATKERPKLFPTLEDGTPDYRDHPRQEFVIPRLGIKTSAAGAFQIEMHEFDFYKKSLKLPNFGHASQIAIAMQMIKECHAFNYIDAGDLDNAVAACCTRWASLPGNNYGQRENEMSVLTQYFTDSGGTLAANGVDNDNAN